MANMFSSSLGTHYYDAFVEPDNMQMILRMRLHYEQERELSPSVWVGVDREGRWIDQLTCYHLSVKAISHCTVLHSFGCAFIFSYCLAVS